MNHIPALSRHQLFTSPMSRHRLPKYNHAVPDATLRSDLTALRVVGAKPDLHCRDEGQETRSHRGTNEGTAHGSQEQEVEQEVDQVGDSDSWWEVTRVGGLIVG
jgi:hypothetical protein